MEKNKTARPLKISLADVITSIIVFIAMAISLAIVITKIT